MRLLREQKIYKEYATPMEIEDEELCQHYLEEVLRRTDIFGEKCIAEWNEKVLADKVWPHRYALFEKRVKQLEDYQAIGAEGNMFATANSASELQEGLADAMEAALGKANAEHALALHDVKLTRRQLIGRGISGWRQRRAKARQCALAGEPEH